MTDIEYLMQLRKPLLRWYHENRRILPWREEPAPYRVWVSEIMLQQTRVEAGKAYFDRFMKALPHVEALANAEEEVLMKLWEGLGYYNRARNLKKAAGIVVEKYSGELPASYEELLTLPGIGPYTAGAIASIAFGIPVPAVDGNVLRVVSRIMARREDISLAAVKKAWEAEVQEIVPQEKPGDFNQALMELGAIVCLPNGAPKCGECPAREICQAKELGLQEEFPVKKAKKARRLEEKTVLLLIDERGRLALHKRPEKGLLSGLWELPSISERLSSEEVVRRLEEKGILCGTPEALPDAKHIFSHIEWHMTGYRVPVKSGDALYEGAADERPELSVAEEEQSYLEECRWKGQKLYSKGMEEKKRREEQARQEKTARQGFQKEDLLFSGERELAEIYALPSAFNGFRVYFPKEGKY